MRTLTLAVLLVSLAACQSRPPYAVGFLGDYSQMKPSPRYPNAWLWQHPGADFSDYDRIVLEPILIDLIKKSPGHDLGDAKLRQIAQDFHKGLVAAIDPYYDVVKAGGAHTMRVQVVLTDVTPAAKDRNGGLAIEVEAVDTITGARLVAAVSRIEWPYEEGAQPLDPKRLEETYAEWGRRFVYFLDTA
jgi:hypothetical protein